MGIIIKDGVIYGNNEPHPEFIEVMPNAGFHNSIFRGKYLGASFTEAQSNVIKAGTFDDLFVGDYWAINGVTWRIADFDAYLYSGNNQLPQHHIIVVPDTALYSTAWDNNTPIVPYIDSAIRANIKASSGTDAGAEEKFIAAFGSSHVLAYKQMYPVTYNDGVATGITYSDARVELMNEFETCGAGVWASSAYEAGTAKRQFSLFRLNPQSLNIRAAWWLRNVSNSTQASIVDGYGGANHANATNSRGVRPFALIA